MILGIVSVLALFFISTQKNLINTELRSRAAAIAKNFAHSCQYPVLLEDLGALEHSTRIILKEQDVVFVQIRTAAGQVLIERGRIVVSEQDLLQGSKMPPVRGGHSEVSLIEKDNLLLLFIPIWKPSDENLSFFEQTGEQPEGLPIASAVIGFSLDRSRQLLIQSVGSILLITVAVAMVGIAVALLTVQYLVRPLKPLMTATREICSGNFSYYVEPSSKDELGVLARSFNEMARTLENNRRALDEYSSELERKVRERTEELTRREEDLVSILENNPTGIVLEDEETGRISWVNSNALSMLKGTREEMEGRVFHDHLRYSTVPAKEAVQGAAGLNSWLVAVDGQEIPVLSSETHVTFNVRKHILHAFFDITEYKKLEAQLLHAQKMAAIGTLAGGIAHDFNNILQAISSYGQFILIKESVSRQTQHCLSRIEDSVAKGAALIRQLLTFSRKIESRLVPLDLNEELQRVSDLFERTLPKRISIELDLCQDIRRINADALQLEQILMNFAVNARDAMPRGGKLVFATRIMKVDESCAGSYLGIQPGHYVRLSVTDSGMGMEKETVEHIFEPFYTTKEVGKGTGLGLAMVYGIVKNHGGYIYCTSAPNRGTTFDVFLPVLDREPAREQIRELRELERNGGSETILLVDDDELIRIVGKEMLASHGYSVVMADCGEDALEIYRSERIDLVILDMEMPGMGGFQCLQKLMNIDRNAKVIVASGYVDDVINEKVQKAGAKGFIGKPYQLGRLLSGIRKSLDQKGYVS
jgi:signal transduction histidine kinase/ActR/RegA family two-component response regulator